MNIKEYSHDDIYSYLAQGRCLFYIQLYKKENVAELAPLAQGLWVALFFIFSLSARVHPWSSFVRVILRAFTATDTNQTGRIPVQSVLHLPPALFPRPMVVSPSNRMINVGRRQIVCNSSAIT